jgi:hypothetical protein
VTPRPVSDSSERGHVVEALLLRSGCARRSRSAVATPCVARARLRTGFGRGAKRRHCTSARRGGGRVKGIVQLRTWAQPRLGDSDCSGARWRALVFLACPCH